MGQIPLNLHTKLTYDPDKFFWHTGVEPVQQHVQTLQKDCFNFIFIWGGARTGKTHLALTIEQILSDQELIFEVRDDFFLEEKNKPGTIQFCKKLDGNSRASEILAEPSLAAENKNPPQFESKCDQHFDNVVTKPISDGFTAEFVNLYENHRLNNSTLILLASQHYDDFEIDDHSRSRLRAARSFKIASPGNVLIAPLALQRGIKLSPTQVKFLEQRLPLSILEIEEYLERLVYFSGTNQSQINQRMISKAL